jgi:hypothetical protein
MCRDNGGQVSTGTDVFNLFPILDSTDRKRIARTCNDIIRETASAREWPDFPLDALAIGANGGGDKLIFLPDPEAPRFADAVYWWDHETGNLQRVADAFEELRIGTQGVARRIDYMPGSCGALAAQRSAFFPILRVPATVCHGDDENAVLFCAVNDAVGIALQEMEAVTIITQWPAVWSIDHLMECSFDGTLETRSRTRAAFGVPGQGFEIIGVGAG